MSDTSKNSQAAKETALRVVSDPSLALLPKGAAPALEDMVIRSLAQIQPNSASGLSQRSSEIVAPLRAGDEREFEIALGVKIVMCWIPAGEFLMGSPEDEESRFHDEMQHRVKITRGFWLAKTQTTLSQWLAVMGDNPSSFKGCKRPVERVSGDDICGNEARTGGFLGKLNQFSRVGGRFDLPTEAQWEYACRAGTSAEYAGDLNEMGWYCGNAERETHPVSQKKPNAWGLHDMQENVREWCADWVGEYEVNAVEDPTGPSWNLARMHRGGSWRDSCYNCRTADRDQDFRLTGDSTSHSVSLSL